MKKISDGKKLFDLAKRTFEVGGVRGERMAVKLLKKSVSLGYLPAFESLAGFYRNGIGISRPDYAKSVMLLRQFVKQCQSCGAYMDLAWCYSHGYGVARSKVMAFKLYRLAARLGEPNAMFNIGLFFERGEGCEKNARNAFLWFRKSARAGCVDALYKVAHAYDVGHGICRNREYAFAWYKKAARRGQVDAMFKVAYAYDVGRGICRNRTLAIGWYKKAARNGNPDAKWNLSLLQGTTEKARPTGQQEGQVCIASRG